MAMLERSMTPETRRFVASGVMLLLLLVLLLVLIGVDIPGANRDLVITVMAVLLGAGSAAIPNLFGDRDAEKDALQREVSNLRVELGELQTAHSLLRDQYDTIVSMLIERHVVEADGIRLRKPNPFVDTQPSN
jgi:hypothetical protein